MTTETLEQIKLLACDVHAWPILGCEKCFDKLLDFARNHITADHVTDAKDAERLRYLMDHAKDGALPMYLAAWDNLASWNSPDEIRAKIDAAMLAAAGEGRGS